MLIVGLGLSTAVGRGTLPSAAAVRAGITGTMQHPFMIDTAGDPMAVAAAPWLDIAMQGVDRFEALLMPALDEAIAPLGRGGPSKDRCTMVLVLPPARPGLPATVGLELAQRVKVRYGPTVSIAHCLEGGHAAGLMALHAARSRLERGEEDACVIASVDSWMAPESLEALEADGQLHAAGTPKNPWGFVPGEGAAAVTVRPWAARAEPGARPYAAVRAIGWANEVCRIKTETVCIGAGLSQAIHAALASPECAPTISDLYSDMNGEPYRADEYGFAVLRTAEYCADGMTCHTPADCLGDLGAAASLALTALAAIGLHRGLGGNGDRLVACSSEDGTRAAARLSGVAATH